MIKIIYDNCRALEGFQEGWGFSSLIDLGNRKILFDTGASEEAFFSNVERLSIRYEEITDVVFSHKHDDHVTGFSNILEKMRPGTHLFLPKGFPKKVIPRGIVVERCDSLFEIGSGVYTLVLKGGLFLYEQALIIETKKGLAIITGCAHPGIVHLLKEVKKQFSQPLYLVLGGFHLFRKNGAEIQGIVEEFQSLKVKIAAPCHCSGPAAIQAFKKAFSDHFCEVGTGSVFQLDDL